MRRYAIAAGLLLVALYLPHPALAKDWGVVERRGMIYHVLLWDKKHERSEAVYRDAISSLCGTDKRTHCILQFWIDKRLVPSFGKDWTDAQAAAQTAYYVNNPHTHYERFLWNCRLKNDPDNCFSE